MRGLWIPFIPVILIYSVHSVRNRNRNFIEIKCISASQAAQITGDKFLIGHGIYKGDRSHKGWYIYIYIWKRNENTRVRQERENRTNNLSDHWFFSTGPSREKRWTGRVGRGLNGATIFFFRFFFYFYFFSFPPPFFPCFRAEKFALCFAKCDYTGWLRWARQHHQLVRS